ncbi:protein FAM110D [Pelodiscus sinensis]|uniref:protein FAM110D n=1 Tax=Pelodiscus sinensis TaxID=13735 RepID=UPI003F6AEB3E
MEVGGGGRTPSAVERLEADKAKYVKTQRVINSRQEPVLRSGPPQPSPRGWRRLTLQQCHEMCQGSERGRDSPPPAPQPPVPRRGSSKRLLRPDSLIIYRQKRDCAALPEETAQGHGLVRRLFQGPGRDKHPDSPAARGPADRQRGPEGDQPPRAWLPGEKEAAGMQSRGGRPVSMSTSPTEPPPPGSQAQQPSPPREAKRELSRGFSLPLSEKERFFSYCGLDRELVEGLGREGFGPARWDAGAHVLRGSVGWASSERSGTAPSSGGEAGPEEPGPRLCASVSIVERNARVIRWLYGCQRAGAAARESTV